MKNKLKIITIFAIFSLPSMLLAINPNFSSAKQNQLQLMEKSGLTQTTTIDAEKTSASAPSITDEKNISTLPQPQPFKIPSPQSLQPQKNKENVTPSKQQEPAKQEDENKKSQSLNINIFAPQQSTKKKKEPTFKFQPPQPPLQPIIKQPQPMVIKYQ